MAAKFVENEFEKCDRLMEVYFRYEALVAAEEARSVCSSFSCLAWLPVWLLAACCLAVCDD